MSDALYDRIDRLRESPSLDVESVDFSMRNAQLVRAELGQVFGYFGKVEGEVEDKSL